MLKRHSTNDPARARAGQDRSETAKPPDHTDAFRGPDGPPSSFRYPEGEPLIGGAPPMAHGPEARSRWHAAPVTTPVGAGTIRAEPAYEPPSPAQTLSDLCNRCGPEGECPYELDYLVRVLVGLRAYRIVAPGELAPTVELPSSAVYGCLLELEDYGLARLLHSPAPTADHVAAGITDAGSRFLHDIESRGRHAG